jgi:hypothetical protein
LAAALLFNQVATYRENFGPSGAQANMSRSHSSASTWSTTLSGTDAYAGLYHAPALAENTVGEEAVNSVSRALVSAARNPAEELRSLTSLPVEALSALMNVSRVAYHDWLRGKPIAMKREASLLAVLAVVRKAAALRTPEETRRWMLAPIAAAGRAPIDYLTNGDFEICLGLALRVPSVNVARERSTLDAKIEELAGVPSNRRPRVPSRGWMEANTPSYVLERKLEQGWRDDDAPLLPMYGAAKDHGL